MTSRGRTARQANVASGDEEMHKIAEAFEVIRRRRSLAFEIRVARKQGEKSSEEGCRMSVKNPRVLVFSW